MWFRTDRRTDGRNGRTDGQTDGRTDDAKTISLRLRRGIITQSTKWTHIKYKITTLVQFTFILIFSHKTIFFFQLLKLYDAMRPDYMHG